MNNNILDILEKEYQNSPKENDSYKDIANYLTKKKLGVMYDDNILHKSDVYTATNGEQFIYVGRFDKKYYDKMIELSNELGPEAVIYRYSYNPDRFKRLNINPYDNKILKRSSPFSTAPTYYTFFITYNQVSSFTFIWHFFKTSNPAFKDNLSTYDLS